MPTPPARFFELADEIGVAFDDGDLDRFSRFLDRLLEANQSFNLTAVRDPDEAWIRHILDSLTLLPLLSALAPGERVAEVGSGGGAPGLPLAIALPELRFTLIESTKKKADYLRRVAAELCPGRVDVVNERAEMVGRDPAHRERCAMCVARALGPLRTALELTTPLVRPGALVAFIKGARAQEEIADAQRALSLLNCSATSVIESPTGRIVVIEKDRPTPTRYPRRPGEPKRDPL